MCGIAGLVSVDARPELGGALQTMLAAIEHRGPDDSGTWVSDDACVHLGHRRLSIIDLSAAGRQPMSDVDASVWITYNGEVYNYRELRRELESLGHRFRTATDTEVIIAAYKEWGSAALNRLRGMFAFALWDLRRRKLVLVRDRAGVKPLYYSFGGGMLQFASELKAIHSTAGFDGSIDRSALMEYFQFGYVSAPRTIYESVASVRPGHYVEFEPGCEPREHKYWDVADYYRKGVELEREGYWDRRGEDDILDEFEEILARGFNYRLVADVPVGLFLSGGIDSSLLAAILAKKLGHTLRTFTIGFREAEFDESPFARRTARELETDHTELMVDRDLALRTTLDIAGSIDEPFGDNSIVPTYLVSKLAGNDVKVVLSADGADELFAGYSRFWLTAHALGQSAWRRFLARKAIAGATGLVPVRWIERAYAGIPSATKKRAALADKILKYQSMLGGEGPADMYRRATSFWQPEELARLGDGEPFEYSTAVADAFDDLPDCDVMTQMMATDFKQYMVGDVLTKVDRASMAVSIEAREPFLDHDLVEFTASLPLRYKYRNGESKYLLKKVLYRYLPREWFTQPKQGFASPVGSWLRGQLKGRVQGIVADLAGIDDNGKLHSAHVAESIARFYSRGRPASNQIWLLLQYAFWRKHWVD